MGRQDNNAVIANGVSGVTHGFHAGSVNVGERLALIYQMVSMLQTSQIIRAWIQRTWVTEEEDAADLAGDFGRELLNGVVNNLTALGVTAHDELGVGTLCENLGGVGCPVRPVSAPVTILH